MPIFGGENRGNVSVSDRSAWFDHLCTVYLRYAVDSSWLVLMEGWKKVNEESFVIAGYRYEHHFGGLGPLNIGTEVDFTDMENHTRHYHVTAIETLQPDTVAGMAMPSGTGDMTIFACVFNGEEKYAVRCVLDGCCDDKDSKTTISE